MSKSFRNQQSNNGITVQKTEAFSGPLPHPDLLLKFNEAVPGAAERIIKMAEEQSAHRRDLERDVVSSDIARSKWGQILGFIIALFGLGVSAVIGIYGNAIASGIIGAGTLASLVGVFMYGSKSRARERQENKG